MGVWDSRLAKVFIQPDGPGNPYYFTDPETDLDALSGGSLSFASDWGARGAYVGSRKTSNPGDVTGTITSRRYDSASRLRDIAESGCLCGILAVHGCTTLDAYDFSSALYLTDAAFTARQNTGGRLVDSTPGENARVVDTLPYRAALAQEWRRLSVGRIYSTGVDGQMLHIIAVGGKKCAGCSPSNDGNQEFIAVGGAVSPSTVPRIYYTSNGGLTWKSCTLTGVTSGVGEKVTIIGDNVLIAVSGASGSVWRVSLTTLRSAATTTSIAATAATGISATSVWNVLAVGNTVFAVGNTGVVWISKDKGYSFSQLSHGLTAMNLFDIAAFDENTVYFGGSAANILAYNAGVFSLVSLASTTVTSISAMAVPNRQLNEVYFSGGGGTGAIWRSRDGLQTFEQVIYTNSGVQIGEIIFAGDRGAMMLWLTTGGAIYLDRSGGAGGAAVQLLRAAASGPNSLVMSSPNYGLVAGHASSLGFFERISG